MPVTVACGVYAILLSVMAFVIDERFRQIFQDFKVELPLISKVVLFASKCLWTYHGWAIFIPMMIAVPAVTIPFLPAPALPESRAKIERVTRTLIVLIIIATVIAIVFSLFSPTIALIQSVSGPHKD